MRVSMKYNGVPAACGSFSYGEVEDYTVNIVSGAKGIVAETELSNKLDFNLYPNPVYGDVLNISGERTRENKAEGRYTKRR